jgi:hypothetical protein
LKLFQNTNFGSFVTKRVCLPLTFLLAAAGLQAASFTFEATSNTVCGTGLMCDGSATFTIVDANTFTVTLNNLLTDIRSAGQLVSDLYFNLDGGTVSLAGSNGTFISVDGSGNPTVGTTGSTGWGFGAPTGTTNTWLLCVICGNGVSADSGVPPSQGVIDVQGSYASANNSIVGNDPHNPFLESGATFTFTTTATLDPNATSSPFTDVALSFGTDFGTEVPTGGGGGGSGNPTPEPVSMLLTGAGLMGLALVTRRRQKARV